MLSRYKNFKKLGAGGMGVVYRAEDDTLKRPVALKFLTGGSYADDAQRARFMREARVAASLNHPAICTVHEVGEVQPGEEDSLGSEGPIGAGTPFITMELIEGRTLESVLSAKRPLPLEDILKLAASIAEGLAAAHAKEIVHRDLKPGNVMLTSDGRLKILDFGLAKPLDHGSDEVMTAAATVSAELTRAGSVLGTVAYMSPEQCAGRTVDSRSDVFSFGIMLYEMAAGQRPFRGDSSTSTLAKILESEPQPLTELRSDLPPDFLRIVRRCLSKNPDDRYNDTRDLVAAIKDLRQETTSGAVAVTGPASGPAAQPIVTAPARRKRTVTWITVLAVAIILILAGFWFLSGTRGRPTATVQPVHRQITFTGKAWRPAISPDGQTIAYATENESEWRVLVQDLAGGQPVEVFRAEGIVAIYWSPTGTELLISAYREGEETNYIVPRLGGAARTVGFRSFGMMDWSPDGSRMAGSAGARKKIWVTEIASGDITEVPLGGSYTWLEDLAWSPDGSMFLFCTADESEKYTLWTITVDGKRQEKLVEGEDKILSPRWSPRGRAIYYLAGREDATELLKIGVDPGSGRPRGEPATVLSGLRASEISLSREGGRLLQTVTDGYSNLSLVDLTPDAAGKLPVTPLTEGTLSHYHPEFSPDGREIAYVANSHLFVMELESRSARQLTFLESGVWSPVWSPDGREIAFGAEQAGVRKVWRIAASGGTPQPFENSRFSSHMTWCPGSLLIYQQPGNQNFAVLDPATGDERPLVQPQSMGWMFDPVCSPDGSRVAISWNRQISPSEFSHDVWIVSVEDGSTEPLLDRLATPARWVGDHLYVAESTRLMRIPVAGGDPEFVVELDVEDATDGTLSPDLKRGVAVISDFESDIWLVENFDPDLN